MYGYLYCENEGLKQLLDNMKFVPNLNIIAENLSFFYFLFFIFFMFLEPYMRMQDRVYVCMPRASLALLFQK